MTFYLNWTNVFCVSTHGGELNGGDNIFIFRGTLAEKFKWFLPPVLGMRKEQSNYVNKLHRSNFCLKW